MTVINGYVKLDQVCVNCEMRFYGGVVSPPKEHTMNGSQLYGSNHEQWLCNSCSKSEDEEIDRVGTNNIPAILAQYLPTSYKL